MRVVYSRITDKYVSLSERAKMANNANVDAFVSIHCNAFSATTAKGLETFSFPSSAAGALLAKRMHDEILKNKSLYTVNRGLKTANFAVLRETNMRSALIETAFITNFQDAQILKTKLDEMAEAIAQGIINNVGRSGSVFLDAGHGGSDPGAVGQGLKEKDITLSLALKVGNILKGNTKLESKPHWAEKDFQELNDNGIKIHDKRFNDSMTRGEAFALMNRIVKK